MSLTRVLGAFIVIAISVAVLSRVTFLRDIVYGKPSA